MTEYLRETFDGGANGANVSTANTASDLVGGTAPTFSTDKHDGTLSMYVNQPTAVASSARFQLGAARSEVYVSCWLKAQGAWPTGNGSPLALRVGATILTDLQLPSGTLRLRGASAGTTLTYSAPSALPVDQWLLLQVHAKVTGATQDVKVWRADGTLLVDSGAQTWEAAAALDNVVAGSVTAIAGVVWRQDTLVVADTAVVPPTAPAVKRMWRKTPTGLVAVTPRRKV